MDVKKNLLRITFIWLPKTVSAVSTQQNVSSGSDTLILPAGLGSAVIQPCLCAQSQKSIQPGSKSVHTLSWTCMCVASLAHFLPFALSASHTSTHSQATMGGGNARNAPNPGLVFWLVPDFMPSPPGSVARPPCARPTGSNARPGQPSSSSRPIINQQAALQLTSHPSPPSPHTSTGASWKVRGRAHGRISQLVAGDALEGCGSIDDVYNTIMCQHSQYVAVRPHEFSGCSSAWDV